MRTRFVTLLAVFVLSTPLSAGTAPEWLIDDELLPAINQSNDRYGYTAALAGRWLAIAAPNRDPGLCATCGEVFLYRRDPSGDWIEMDTLQASGAGTTHLFGYMLDFDDSGRRLAISAYGENGNRGAAYVYAFDPGSQSWSEEQRLVADDVDGSRLFGPVSLDGDRLLVGAQSDDEEAVDAGAAYLFLRDTGTGIWSQTLKLTAPDAASGDIFGVSVALAGDWALVGARGADEIGSDAGAAYVFGRNIGGPDQWGFAVKLLASDGAAGDLFGNYVALAGDIAVVGAHLHDLPANDAGAAWVFERDHPTPGAWGERAKLVAPDADSGEIFSRGLVIDGDRIAVGAAGGDQGGGDLGSVYLYGRSHGGANFWGLAGTAAPTTGQPGQCGLGVALDGPFLSCGRPFDAGFVNRANAFADPAWIFGDGFESGNLTYWSSATL